jgi:DNA-binding transcriptional ArsR family regulator
MVLRDANILETRREGKYIFYRIADESIFDLFATAADLQQISAEQLPRIAESGTHNGCVCPKCEPEAATETISP